jgi:hypothetical protein
MAEIFLARQEGPRGFAKTVVIKRVLPELVENENFVKMFLDEATLAAHLSHPNVVQITDFGEVDGTYFLAMEFLQGSDLFGLIRAREKLGLGPVGCGVAALIAAAVSEGLHYAHTLNGEDSKPLRIVHRDVSPNNIFVTRQGAVKVLDFGIAKAEGKIAKTRAGVIKGKAMYMSPEQTSGAVLDARSDVFALGVVLYEMVTGMRPFKRDGDYATLSAIMTDEPKPAFEVNPAVPLALSQIITRAMAKPLEARFQSALELRRELDAFVVTLNVGPQREQLKAFVLECLGPEAMTSEPLLEPLPDTDPEVAVATRMMASETRAAEPDAPLADETLIGGRAASLAAMETPIVARAAVADETLVGGSPAVGETPIAGRAAVAPLSDETLIGGRVAARLPDDTLTGGPMPVAEVKTDEVVNPGEVTVRVPGKKERAAQTSLAFPLTFAALAIALAAALVWFARGVVSTSSGPEVIEILPNVAADAGPR